MTKKAQRKKKAKTREKKELTEAEAMVALALTRTLDGRFNDETYIAASMTVFRNALLENCIIEIVDLGRVYFKKHEKEANPLSKDSPFATPIGIMTLNEDWDKCGQKLIDTLLGEHGFDHDEVFYTFSQQQFYLLGMFVLLEKLAREGAVSVSSEADSKERAHHNQLIANSVSFVKHVLLAYAERLANEAQDTGGHKGKKPGNPKRSTRKTRGR